MGLGEDAIVKMNIAVDSASPVSFLKQNVLHELKLRNLKILPIEKKIWAQFCGFTNATINTVGKIAIRIQSNGWISEETPIFIITGHERNILENKILPRIGKKIAQRQLFLPVNTVSLRGLCKSTVHSNTILNMLNNFEGLFNNKITLE